jgi:DNA-binding PucR family transcriptional regulator
MRVEIIDETEDQGPAMIFPPGKNYVDLRENPRAVERIKLARRYPLLQSFLAAVNSADSLFRSASVSTQNDSRAPVSAGEACEFASQTSLVFTESSLNFERDHFLDLTACLKELLERDSGDAIRTVLRISTCEFAHENRRGFCLSIHLVARGASAEQAEIRWGLGLARLQQALLFRARALRQQFSK